MVTLEDEISRGERGHKYEHWGTKHVRKEVYMYVLDLTIMITVILMH